MKILDRYIVREILRSAAAALIIFSLLVMAVETFINVDKFVSNELSFFSMLYYSFFALSKYFLMVSSVSLLFATTYFLSNLSANNELISLYTAGYSKMRILFPIVLLAILLTSLFTLLNESVFLRWKSESEVVSQNLFGLSGTHDARNVNLSDKGFLVYASRYSDERRMLYDPLVISSGDDGIRLRIEAEYAVNEGDIWVFKDAIVYERSEDGFSSSVEGEYVNPDFDFESELFKSQNLSLDTMQYGKAVEYLEKLKTANPSSWHEKRTEFLIRLSEPMGILTLMMISILLDYSFKKNILLFSIVQSLLIAVVYFVSNMVFSIICKQGMLPPFFVVLAPLLLTIILSMAISYIGKRI